MTDEHILLDAIFGPSITDVEELFQRIALNYTGYTLKKTIDKEKDKTLYTLVLYDSGELYMNVSAPSQKECYEDTIELLNGETHS